MLKTLVFLLAFLPGCAGCQAPASVTPAQQAVNAALSADLEFCYQSSTSAQEYVTCADKYQRCAATSADFQAYSICRGH